MAKTKQQKKYLSALRSYRAWRVRDFLKRYGATDQVSEARARFLLGEASRYYRKRYNERYKRGSKSEPLPEKQMFLARIREKLETVTSKEVLKDEILKEGPYWEVLNPAERQGDLGESYYGDYIRKSNEEFSKDQRRKRLKYLDLIAFIYVLSQGRSGLSDKRTKEVFISGPGLREDSANQDENQDQIETLLQRESELTGDYSTLNLDSIDIALRGLVQIYTALTAADMVFSDMLYKVYFERISPTKVNYDTLYISFQNA